METQGVFQKAQKAARAKEAAKSKVQTAKGKSDKVTVSVAAANVSAGKAVKGEARVMPAKVAAKIATNNAHKADAGSISFCMKRAAEFNDGFIEKLPFVTVGELKRKAIAPAELIALMTEKEGQRFAKSGRVTVWAVMTLLGRLNGAREAAAKAKGGK